MENGQLQAIWIKRMKSGPLDPVDSAELIAGRGIERNANQGGRRQITLIEQEVWEDLMRRLDASISPATRRANLMLSGIRLADSRDRILHVGACRVRILGETKPCAQMDAALFGLREAMVDGWAGGAFGEVLDDGRITVGDPVWWDE